MNPDAPNYGEQVAVVHLTRRSDLQVFAAEPSLGVDLLVIHPTTPGSWFGVSVTTLDACKPRPQGGKIGIPVALKANRVQALEQKNHPVPAGMLFVTRNDGRSFWGWIRHPAAHGRPLNFVRDLHRFLVEFNRAELDRVVREVDDWARRP